MATYFTLITKLGQALEATAKATGNPVQLTHMAVGDGNGVEITPQESQTALVREVWRGALNSLEEDPDNEGWLKAESVIPESVGGFTIREVGLFDASGKLYAVGNLPASYKPQLAEGSAKTFYLRMRIETSNASSVTLLIDPSIVLATRSWVTIEIGKVRTDLDAHIADLDNPHQTTASQVGAEPAGAVVAHNADEEAHPDIRALIAGLSGARYEPMWLGAGAMIPSKTNGATATVVEGANYKLVSDMLTFSASVDQSAQAVFALPDNWDRGTIKVKVHWRPAAAGATAGQHVGWLVSGGAVGDGDVVDRALGASVTVDDQVLAGLETVEHASAASAAITLGGDPQVGDRLHLKITRDADYAGGGTAMPVLAGLLGLEIQYRVTGAVAAWG